MKFSILFVLFLTITITQKCLCVNPHHLVINIEQDEMEHIAEILIESYLAHNVRQQPVSHRIVLLSIMKQAAFRVVQLFGITMSLVSANLITKMFETSDEIQVPIVDNTVNATNAKKAMCDRDFGCINNVCWRSCDNNEISIETDLWCYSSPKPELRNYQPCAYSHDCSPCWDCISACQ